MYRYICIYIYMYIYIYPHFTGPPAVFCREPSRCCEASSTEWAACATPKGATVWHSPDLRFNPSRVRDWGYGRYLFDGQVTILWWCFDSESFGWYIYNVYESFVFWCSIIQCFNWQSTSAPPCCRLGSAGFFLSGVYAGVIGLNTILELIHEDFTVICQNDPKCT